MKLIPVLFGLLLVAGAAVAQEKPCQRAGNQDIDLLRCKLVLVSNERDRMADQLTTLQAALLLIRTDLAQAQSVAEWWAKCDRECLDWVRN